MGRVEPGRGCRRRAPRGRVRRPAAAVRPSRWPRRWSAASPGSGPARRGRGPGGVLHERRVVILARILAEEGDPPAGPWRVGDRGVQAAGVALTAAVPGGGQHPVRAGLVEPEVEALVGGPDQPVQLLLELSGGAEPGIQFGPVVLEQPPPVDRDGGQVVANAVPGAGRGGAGGRWPVPARAARGRRAGSGWPGERRQGRAAQVLVVAQGADGQPGRVGQVADGQSLHAPMVAGYATAESTPQASGDQADEGAVARPTSHSVVSVLMRRIAVRTSPVLGHSHGRHSVLARRPSPPHQPDQKGALMRRRIPAILLLAALITAISAIPASAETITVTRGGANREGRPGGAVLPGGWPRVPGRVRDVLPPPRRPATPWPPSPSPSRKSLRAATPPPPRAPATTPPPRPASSQSCSTSAAPGSGTAGAGALPAGDPDPGGRLPHQDVDVLGGSYLLDQTTVTRRGEPAGGVSSPHPKRALGTSPCIARRSTRPCRRGRSGSFDPWGHMGLGRIPPDGCRGPAALANEASAHRGRATASGRADDHRHQARSCIVPAPPCPRRALHVDPQRSSTDNHVAAHARRAVGSAHPELAESASQARGGALLLRSAQGMGPDSPAPSCRG